MRIAHFTTSFPRFAGDEAGIFLKRLIEAMSGLGHSGLIFVPWDNNENLVDQCGSFQVVRFRYSLIDKGRLAFGAGIMPNIRANPLVIAQAPLLMLKFFLYGFKNKKNIDLIHAHWIPTAIPLTLLNYIKKLPLVITLHGEDLKLLRKRYLRPLMLFALNKASAIVCVNTSAEKELRDTFPKLSNKIFCIPNGANITEIKDSDLQSFIESKKSILKKPVALFVGSVVPRKGIHLLIEGISRTKNWTAIICGRIQDQSYFKELTEQIARLNCKDRIIFEGAVDPELIAYYMKATDAYVSASSHEGRPCAVLEALTSSMPTILSAIPAHREVIENEKSGLLFNLDNTSELADALTKLEEHPELKNNLSKAAKEAVAGMTWESCAKQYISLFKTFIT